MVLTDVVLVFCFRVDDYKLNFEPHFVYPLLLLCSICSFFPLPFRIGVSMYYMFFFYVGYHLQRNNINLEKFYSLRWIVGLIASFLVLFPSLTVVQQYLINKSKLLYSFCIALLSFALEIVNY